MSIDQFRSNVPIQTYTELKSWIKRIQKGESNILWPGKPKAFVTTSGTTGENKLLPVTQDFLKNYHLGSTITFQHLIFRYPHLLFGDILTLGGPSEEQLIGSVPIGSITGILYKSLPQIIKSRLIIPQAVFNIRSYEEKLYVITRLAIEARLVGIISIIPSSLIILAESIDKLGKSLIEEIKVGNFRSLSTAPVNLEKNIRSTLRPNKERAEELQRVLEKNKKLTPKNIWPIRVFCTYLKGSHSSQWDKIKSYYGNLVTIDPGLVASEGRVSIGWAPYKTYSAVILFGNFIEFLPVDINHTEKLYNKKTLLPDQLQVGNSYTPIISSANGLMRYHIQDVIKVVKKKWNIPFIEYQGRLDGTLSAVGEKMAEVHFQEALRILQKSNFSITTKWNVNIDWSTVKPRYIFTVEEKTSRDAEMRLDNVLQHINISYFRKRDQKLLDPLVIEQVPPGTIPLHPNKPHWIGQTKESHLSSNNQ